MNSQKTDTEDQEFAAFLEGSSALSQRLKQIPQPEPSEALSAAILAQAEQALHKQVAANDVGLDDSTGKVVQMSSFQRVARRFTVPLALAAGLLITVTVGMQWRQQSQEIPLVAQRPAPVPDAGTETKDAADAPLASSSAPVPAKTAVPGGDMMAQADIGAAAGSTVVRSGSAAPSATTATPVPSDPAAKDADDKAKAWLLLIDGLLNSGMRRDALDEWTEFRKKYPDYVVADALQERIRTLAAPSPAEK